MRSIFCMFLSICGGVLFSDAAVRADEEFNLRMSANRVEISRDSIHLEFDTSGNGFLGRAILAGKEVCKSSSASGLFASLIVPSAATETQGPIIGKEIQGEAKVTSIIAQKDGDNIDTRIVGNLVFPEIGEASFTVKIRVPRMGPVLAVSAELKIPDKARRYRLGSFGVAIPLNLHFHPTSRTGSQVDRTKAAAAILPRSGTPIPEIRWLVAEQNQESVWGPMLWTLAGIRQLTPQAMEVWESWLPITPRFVLQHHRVHPGWMAVADKDAVLAAGMAGITRIAPKEIYVDSQAKVMRICFQSPFCRPLPLDSAPETLTVGPAYVFLEPAEPKTRQAESYLQAKNAPRLASLTERLKSLPTTECNFASWKIVEPKPLADCPPLPGDKEFFTHEKGPADEINLWVDNPQSQDLDWFPITRGIPLARGVLHDEKKVSMQDAVGKAVPCVGRATAFWPDGNIKWLLLDFHGQLKAGNEGKFRVLTGAQAKPVEIPRPLQVSQEKDQVTVDTGKLRVNLHKQDNKLALAIVLDLNDDGKITAEETIISSDAELFGCLFTHVEDSAHYPSQTWTDPGKQDPGQAEILGLEVEEQSPLRTVIKIKANLKHQHLASTIPQGLRPRIGTPVTLRLHLFANSSLVRLQHTFMFAGDVRHDFLRQLGFRLPISPKEAMKISTSVDGREITLPVEGAAGILQENPDSALLWQGNMRQSGRRADGWLNAVNDRWGVAVGLRHMREMFPQEIHCDRDGIWTHFYSPHVSPMDVRRYAFKYGDGESTSTGFGSAFGALRTHEAFWCFYPVKKGNHGKGMIQAMLQPPLARVSPRYVADTLAVGPVAEHGRPTNDPHMDAVLYHLPRMHQHNRQFWRWFGFWDFGDEILVHDAGRQRWARDDGRYGWYNNEPVRDYNLHLAYLLTGNRRIWEQAAAMSYHVFEVDVRHANPQPFMSAGSRIEKQQYAHSTTHGIDLCGRRHNCQHWADGYFGPRVGSPPGFRLCYYQSGDPVMREYLQRLIASALATQRSPYMGADGDEAILWAMIAGYEMTGEQKYLDRIKSYVDLQVEFARNHKGFPASQANWDWASNKAGAPPADPREDLWIWSFGGDIGLMEATLLLNVKGLDRMLGDWTLALEGFGSDKKRRESWSNNIGALPMLAHYYRTTGDPRALEWYQRRLKSFHSQVPKTAPTDDLSMDQMDSILPEYTPNDGHGWVYTTSTFWYVGIPAWQGARAFHGQK